MPLLVGMVAVLFQLGILFISYLAIVHEVRDIGRYVAVHPDMLDGTTCSSATSLWKQLCADAPTVIDSTRLSLVVTPACASLTGGACAGRSVGSEIKVTVTYNAASSIFLPSNFRLGPWLNVAIPTTLPAYDYSIMVEPH